MDGGQAVGGLRGAEDRTAGAYSVQDWCRRIWEGEGGAWPGRTRHWGVSRGVQRGVVFGAGWEGHNHLRELGDAPLNVGVLARLPPVLQEGVRVGRRVRVVGGAAADVLLLNTELALDGVGAAVGAAEAQRDPVGAGGGHLLRHGGGVAPVVGALPCHTCLKQKITYENYLSIQFRKMLRD